MSSVTWKHSPARPFSSRRWSPRLYLQLWRPSWFDIAALPPVWDSDCYSKQTSLPGSAQIRPTAGRCRQLWPSDGTKRSRSDTSPWTWCIATLSGTVSPSRALRRLWWDTAWSCMRCSSRAVVYRSMGTLPLKLDKRQPERWRQKRWRCLWLYWWAAAAARRRPSSSQKFWCAMNRRLSLRKIFNTKSHSSSFSCWPCSFNPQC